MTTDNDNWPKCAVLQDLGAVAHDTQLVQARLPIEEYNVSVSQMTLYNIPFLNRNQVYKIY